MMKDEWRMMSDKGWMMNDDPFKLLRGFDDRQTTFVNVELLLQLKISIWTNRHSALNWPKPEQTENDASTNLNRQR